MNIEQVFEKIRKDIALIKSNEIIIDQYTQLEKMLNSKNIEVIHYFSQIRRNQQFKGLISETMFFDRQFIYDIVVGVDNLDTHLVLLKHVSKVNITTNPNYIEEKKDDGIISQRTEYNSQLHILYQEQSQLYYQTPTDKYGELLRIAEILTKMISL